MAASRMSVCVMSPPASKILTRGSLAARRPDSHACRARNCRRSRSRRRPRGSADRRCASRSAPRRRSRRPFCLEIHRAYLNSFDQALVAVFRDSASHRAGRRDRCRAARRSCSSSRSGGPAHRPSARKSGTSRVTTAPARDEARRRQWSWPQTIVALAPIVAPRLTSVSLEFGLARNLRARIDRHW